MLPYSRVEMVHVSSLHGSSIKALNLILDAPILNAAHQRKGVLGTASEPEEGDA